MKLMWLPTEARQPLRPPTVAFGGGLAFACCVEIVVIGTQEIITITHVAPIADRRATTWTAAAAAVTNTAACATGAQQ